MYDFTLHFSPALTLSYHTQGGEIYRDFQKFVPDGAEALAADFAGLSGYDVREPAPFSSFAGYKDWFIQAFRRPGFTVEAGRGCNPLPLSALPSLYRENLGIFLRALRPF